MLTALMLTVALGGYAQKSKVSKAIAMKDAGKWDLAMAAINEATDDSNPKAEPSIAWPKTWLEKGNIYREIGVSTDANIRKLAPNALNIALASYKKAIEVDKKGKGPSELKDKLQILNLDFVNQGVAAWNAKDFATSLAAFENVLAIAELSPMKDPKNPAAVDTAIYFNAALAAQNCGNHEAAIKYFSETEKYGYRDTGPDCVSSIGISYTALGDTAKALSVLDEGFKKYPTSVGILTAMTNIYMAQGKAEETLTYLDKAIALNPKNAEYYFAKGSFLDSKSHKPYEAIEAYKKAIEVNPDYTEAIYNLGAVYHNLGVEQDKVVNSVPPGKTKEFEEEKAKANALYEQAVPWLEKASSLKKDDINILSTLKQLYYRLQNLDKYDEIVKKIESLN